MRRLLALLPVVVAGCLAPGADLVDGPESPAPDAGLPSPLRLTGCDQYHTYFAGRGEDFAGNLAPGFTPKTDQFGFLDLGIGITRCPDGAAEAWIFIPVNAPPERAVPDHAPVAVIEAYAVDGPLLETYRGWGVPLVQAARFDFTLGGVGGPVLTDLVDFRSDAHHYSLRMTMQPSSGQFRAEPVAAFLAVDGRLAGVLVVDPSVSQTRGFGPVLFGYEGSGGAPPAHAGIAHRVGELDLVASYLRVDA